MTGREQTLPSPSPVSGAGRICLSQPCQRAPGGVKRQPWSFGIKGALSPSITENVNAEEPLPSTFLSPAELQEGNV